MKSQAKIVRITDISYPPLLREIHDPPDQLFVYGSLDLTDKPVVAVVGSRKITAYGRQAVQRIIKPLAEAGIVIVSGLALGVDGAAHEAALDAGGTTIAVLGTPINKIYPFQHLNLARRMYREGGAIVSEVGPDGETHRGSFPRRNRIIAGMAHATIIIEAAFKSGSLITAKQALEENREVFAVPGPISSETSEGTNNLLKLGARLLTDANDVLELFGKRLAPKLERVHVPAEAAPIVALLSPTDPVHIDKLAESVTIDLPQLQSQLTILELRGIVKMVTPGMYIRL